MKVRVKRDVIRAMVRQVLRSRLEEQIKPETNSRDLTFPVRVPYEFVIRWRGPSYDEISKTTAPTSTYSDVEFDVFDDPISASEVGRVADEGKLNSPGFWEVTIDRAIEDKFEWGINGLSQEPEGVGQEVSGQGTIILFENFFEEEWLHRHTPDEPVNWDWHFVQDAVSNSDLSTFIQDEFVEAIGGYGRWDVDVEIRIGTPK